MAKLKPISSNELIRVAEKLGYHFARQRGSHATFVNSGGSIVVIPIHAGKKIDGGLLLKIVKKDFKITREEFEEYL